MHNSRILVTGGAGFIGSSLVDRLIREGHDVIVLDNFFAGATGNLEERLSNNSLRLVKGDIRDQRAVKESCKRSNYSFPSSCTSGRVSFCRKPSSR